jgi:hypothetical protein
VEAIHLGFTSDMSCRKFWVPSTGQFVYTNQAKYDEDWFPYRNKEIIEGRLAEDSDMDILSQEIPEVKWIQYTSDIDLMDFEKVHIGESGGDRDYVLLSIAQPDKYMNMDREQFFKSLLDKHSDELLRKARALVDKMEAEPSWVGDHNSMRMKGLPDSIDPKKPPRNYRDAMSRKDKLEHEWAESYMAEYQGFWTQGRDRHDPVLAVTVTV